MGEFEDFASRTKMSALSLAPSEASAAMNASSQPIPSQMTSSDAATGTARISPTHLVPLTGSIGVALSSSQQVVSVPEAGAPAEGGEQGKGSTPGFGPQHKLLVVDDLPHASDAEQRVRLAGALSNLLLTARFPTVLMGTEVTDRGGASERLSTNTAGLHPVRCTFCEPNIPECVNSS